MIKKNLIYFITMSREAKIVMALNLLASSDTKQQFKNGYRKKTKGCQKKWSLNKSYHVFYRRWRRQM
jgi:hypothetical protein